MDANVKARTRGLGGTDAAGILGMSPWSSPLNVYLETIGEAPPFEGNDSTHWGNVLEAPICEEWARRTGQKIRRHNKTLVHPEHDFLIGHIDRRILNVRAQLEAKTAGIYTADHWGEEGTDEVPAYYAPQAQHYMGIANLDYTDFAVLIGGNDFRMYRVERDDEFIREMHERMTDFWFDHVVPRVPPDPQSFDEAKLVFRPKEGEIEASPEVCALVEQYQRAKADAEAAGKQADAARLEIMRLIEGQQKVKLGKRTLVSYGETQRKAISVTELRQQHPDIAKSLEKVSTSRTLRLYPKALEVSA